MADSQKERTEKRERKRRIAKRRKLALVIIAVLLITGAALRNFISLKAENRRLRKKNEKLIEQRKELKKELSSVNSEEFIERRAREELRLANPDEILFVFPEGEDKINTAGEGEGNSDKDRNGKEKKEESKDKKDSGAGE